MKKVKMKKSLIALSLLALTACEDSIEEIIQKDSEISGDITMIDDGSNVLSGNVDLTEDATFITQTNTETTLGLFSISPEGAWIFEPNRAVAGFIALPDKQTLSDTITVKTSDGQSKTITITLIGANDVAEFSTGDGIDSGTIKAELGNVLTGNLLVIDPDTSESALIEQEAIQGSFGSLSVSSTGEWTYTFNTFATGFVSPDEEFTVKSIDGTEHQVIISVSGLYQRLSSITGVEGEKVYYEVGSTEYELYGEYYTDEFALADLFDEEKLKGYVEKSGDITSYEYTELGDRKTVSYFDLDFDSSNTASQVYDYQYEYTDGEFSKVEYDRLRYSYTGEGEETYLYSQSTYKYTIANNKKIDRSFTSYSFEDADSLPEISLYIEYIDVYNNIGKISEFYKSYLDTENRTIEPAYQGDQLQYQYFYNESGLLDYFLYYRASSFRLYEGVARQEEYFYTEQNRTSYTLRYSASSTSSDVDGVTIAVHDDVKEDAPTKRIYSYLDELNTVLVYSNFFSDVQLDKDSTIYSADIYQYEDVNNCGQAEQFIYNTERPVLPVCKPKIAPASSLITELP